MFQNPPLASAFKSDSTATAATASASPMGSSVSPFQPPAKRPCTLFQQDGEFAYLLPNRTVPHPPSYVVNFPVAQLPLPTMMMAPTAYFNPIAPYYAPPQPPPQPPPPFPLPKLPAPIYNAQGFICNLRVPDEQAAWTAQRDNAAETRGNGSSIINYNNNNSSSSSSEEKEEEEEEEEEEALAKPKTGARPRATITAAARAKKIYGFLSYGALPLDRSKTQTWGKKGILPDGLKRRQTFMGEGFEFSVDYAKGEYSTAQCEDGKCRTLLIFGMSGAGFLVSMREDRYDAQLRDKLGRTICTRVLRKCVEMMLESTCMELERRSALGIDLGHLPHKVTRLRAAYEHQRLGLNLFGLRDAMYITCEDE